VDMPLTVLQKDGTTQTVSARVRMSVGLQAENKGTHMSRFIMQLSEWSRNNTFSVNFDEFLQEMQHRLEAPTSEISVAFRYFMEKAAPVTKLSAPMGYDCTFLGQLHGTHYQFTLGVTVPISTLCPCSKTISDYGAHNQRAEIRVKLLIDSQENHALVWIEDLITALDECASCPVYPLLKRADEKWVTERQYDNPKFVEDVIRDATLVLRNYPGVQGFELEVEALESIHGHNAWAFHSECKDSTLLLS
jgi:GTP cyclohydrolase IB